MHFYELCCTKSYNKEVLCISISHAASHLSIRIAKERLQERLGMTLLTSTPSPAGLPWRPLGCPEAHPEPPQVRERPLACHGRCSPAPISADAVSLGQVPLVIVPWRAAPCLPPQMLPSTSLSRRGESGAGASCDVSSLGCGHLVRHCHISMYDYPKGFEQAMGDPKAKRGCRKHRQHKGR